MMTELSFLIKAPLLIPWWEAHIWSSNMLGNDIELPVSIVGDFWRFRPCWGWESQIWSQCSRFGHMLSEWFPTVHYQFSNHEIATSDRFPIFVNKPSFPKSNGTNSDFPFSWTSFKWCHCFKADLLLCSDSPSSSLTFATKLIMLYFHTMNYYCICTWLALCKLMQSNITLTGVICPSRCFVSCHLDCHLSGPLTGSSGTVWNQISDVNLLKHGLKTTKHMIS